MTAKSSFFAGFLTLLCMAAASLRAYGQEVGTVEDFTIGQTAQPAIQSRQSSALRLSNGGNTNNRVRPIAPVGRIVPDGSLLPLTNQPTAPLEGFRRANTDDPFAPLGLRAGRFTFLPILSHSLGHTHTKQSSTSEGTFYQTDARLRFASDSSRHALEGEIGGTIQKFLDDETNEIKLADGRVNWQHDLSLTTSLRLGFGFDYIGELGANSIISDPTSNTALNSITQGAQLVVNGFAELNRTAGVNNLLLRGAFERTQFSDATLSNGADFDQGDQNNWLTTLTARFTRQTTAVANPFLEVSVGQRLFRQAFDRDNIARSSTRSSLRAGLKFDRGPKLNGEFAVGYAAEVLEESSFDTLGGLTLDGVINWSTQRESFVSLSASTTIDSVSDPTESGVISYTAGLGFVRILRPNLSLNAQVNASNRRFGETNRQEQVLQLQTGMEWQLNRHAALFGSVGHEIVESDDGASDDASTTARLGFRVRR